MSTESFVKRANSLNQDMRDTLSQLRQVSEHIFGYHGPDKSAPSSNGATKSPTDNSFFGKMGAAQYALDESHQAIVAEVNHIMEHLGMLEGINKTASQAPSKQRTTVRTMPAFSDPDGLMHPRPHSPQEDRDLESRLAEDLGKSL